MNKIKRLIVLTMCAVLLSSTGVSASVTIPVQINKDNVIATTTEWVVTESETQGMLIMPMISNGTLSVNLSVNVGNGYYTFTLYSDAAMTKTVGKVIVAGTQEGSVKATYEVSKGTYYMAVDRPAKDKSKVSGVMTCVLDVKSDQADTTVLKNTLFVPATGETVIYTKYTAKSSGILHMYASSESYTEVTLCSSNKKAISSQIFIDDSKSYDFAVNKGVYYFKIQCSYDSQIIAKFDSIKVYANTTKSQAKVLKLNKPINVLIPTVMSKTKAYWYKLTLTKPTELDLMIDYVGGSGSMKVSVTSEKITDVSLVVYEDGIGGQHMLQADKEIWPKGVYYIKVSKTSKTGNGFLKLSAVTK